MSHQTRRASLPSFVPEEGEKTGTSSNSFPRERKSSLNQQSQNISGLETLSKTDSMGKQWSSTTLLSNKSNTSTLSNTTVQHSSTGSDPEWNQLKRIHDLVVLVKFKRTALGLLLTLILFNVFYTVLYLGSGWQPASKLSNLSVGILSLDTPATIEGTGRELLLGPEIVDVFKTNFSSLFSWQLLEQNSTKQLLMEKVETGELFVTILISEDFTSNVVSFFGNNSSKAKQNAVLEVIWDEGRDSLSQRMALGAIEQVWDGIRGEILKELHDGAQAESIRVNGALFAKGLGLQKTNLHPKSGGMSIFLQVAPLVLWIGSLVSVSIIFSYVGKNMQEVRKLQLTVTSSRDVRRILDALPPTRIVLSVLTLLFFFTLLNSSLVSLVVSFFPGYTMVAGPIKTWFFMWLISVTFVSVNTMFFSIFGEETGSSVSSIFLVLQQVASESSLSYDLQPSVYLYGKALPMFYATRGLKYMLFGSAANHMVDNILILGVWAIGALTVAVIFGLAMIKRIRRGYLSKLFGDMSIARTNMGLVNDLGQNFQSHHWVQ